jgi:hypothetical protein
MFAHVYSPFGAVCAIPPLRLPARLGCTSLASVPPSWRATSRPHLRNRSLVRWLYHVGRITPHDFADDLRDPICDVNVVARTNRVSGDGPLSSGGGVGVGNVVEVVRGRGGESDVGCGVRWSCLYIQSKALGSPVNAVSHALTSPAGTTKPVLATIVSVRFRASSLDDNTSPFPSQIASNSFRSCSTCSVSHLRTCSAIAIAFLLGARSLRALRIVSSCGDGGAFSSTSPAPSFCSGGWGCSGGSSGSDGVG